ncbi:MAG TPA: response regulator [Deltaproteobacteria bacterium]|nr:response regulator [Deltaproteobacteria bacterium]
MNTPWRPLRVLIADSSALARRLARQQIDADERLEVVSVVPSLGQLRDAMVTSGPDLILVEEEIGGHSGIALIRQLMTTSPIPSVLLSGSVDADLRRRAARAGIVGVVEKPASLNRQDAFWERLRQTLRSAARAHIPRLPPSGQAPRVIGIAISTGGPPVVRYILSELPATLPPIVIVQHMRDAFIGQFAEQLDRVTPIRVVVAEHRQVLRPGWCYIAPGGHQTRVNADGNTLRTCLGPPQPVSGHLPSGDALLYSIAYSVGGASAGAVLTGIGLDGAAGLLAMRRAGAQTLAQDKATSTVFGMPRVAAEYGAAARVVSLTDVPGALKSTALVR